MRITVFGATGTVGRQVVAESVRRGHDVTAVSRDPARSPAPPPGVRSLAADVGSVEDVADATRGQDLAISATRPGAGHENELVAMTIALLGGLARTGVRALIVGGAGSLTVPGSADLVADDPRFVPPAWRAIAMACVDQLAVCRADSRVDWTYVSPPALLVPGERTGRYRLGGDELLVDTEGRSVISVQDFAVVLLDEAERRRHLRTRITAAY
jgi:putative NADH-flavin reductase